MRISHKQRFIFFANPKTGSETVRNLLDPVSDIRGVSYLQITREFPFYSHMRPVECKAVFDRAGARFEEYFRFTFTRNPWARMVSLYKMIRRQDREITVPFGDWLRSVSPGAAGGGGHDSQRWRKFGTYSLQNFAGDGTGNLLVNEVFRMEDMQHVIADLRQRGIVPPGDAQVPRINASPDRARWQDWYDDETRALVSERYRDDISLFGYAFEDP